MYFRYIASAAKTYKIKVSDSVSTKSKTFQIMNKH
ncbi:hypothetical protein SAMN05421820_11566 [Pedobacter steynii]|uniref:Uncharacterized protein n=1 Tax=Pedobacter steynii TaxID=430522 RepID=A0A1H0JTM2_9SPHI|nr:hypothetical protein SAMN05421820_11566 [Pedobacter steynii]